MASDLLNVLDSAAPNAATIGHKIIEDNLLGKPTASGRQIAKSPGWRAEKTHSIERSFGLRLRAKRDVLGVSQEELADRSGLHRSYVSQLERGLKSPSLSTLFALASALKIDITDLVRDLARTRPEGR